MQKFLALFTTVSGWSLICTFVIAGLTAVETHFTGNALATITTIITLLGIIGHPTSMVAGRVVER